MENNSETSKLIKRTFEEQRFAVLATQSGGQPYTSLVAFAEAENLRSLLFVTSRDTRKYLNALASKKVALLIDSRKNKVSDLSDAVAITALGTVVEVAAANEEELSRIFLNKHPQLREFITRPSNALMKVDVTEYVVATFEGARRVAMGDTT